MVAFHMSLIWSRLRNHLHVIVVVIALIIVMTWPTIRYVFDTEVFWLPTKVFDVWTKFWNAWFGKLLLTGQAEYSYTDLMFYPNGVSLDFHNFAMPHMLLQNVFGAFLPMSNAYNLVYLLTIFAAVISAYVYLLYLFRHRWISLFGAIVFGCSIYVIARPSQPDVTMIFSIPLTLYYLHRAVLEKKWRLAAISGFWAGVTAFTGYYTYIVLLIALGLYILYFSLERWRKPEFWLRIVLMLAIAGSFGFARAYPMLRDSHVLEEALTKGGGQESNNDLVQNFVNFDHPLLTPIFRDLFDLNIDPRWNTSYLGYLPLLLIVLGFTRPTYRRKMFFWLYLMIPFLLLRLGSVLTVNGQQFNDIVLPKHLLNELIPAVFGAFHSTDYFHAGVLLPLAVLSCYGLMTLLHALRSKYRLLIIVMLIALLAFEYYVPLDQMFISEQQFAFLEWLAQEDDQGTIRLINVPMGRIDAKLYDFYQTLSGYPHVEGVAGRTPPAAYDYINKNLILAAWSEGKSLRCQIANQDDYLHALDSLATDGFSHVIRHRTLWNPSRVSDSFIYTDAAFKNEFSVVYRLSQLRESCPGHMHGNDWATHLQRFLTRPDIVPKSNETLLSLHPAEAPNEKLVRFYAGEAAGWKGLIHILDTGSSGIIVQSSEPDYSTMADIASRNSIVWLIYNPQQTALSTMGDFADQFANYYKTCQRLELGDDTVFEYAISKDFPCELVDLRSSLAVTYESRIQLAERLIRDDPAKLDIYLWWSGPRDGKNAYSVQVFNEHGQKVSQSDHVILADPLQLHSIDKAGFASGRYSVRLIVYDYVTKQSQPGTILGNQETFRRELEIARFTVTP